MAAMTSLFGIIFSSISIKVIATKIDVRNIMPKNSGLNPYLIYIAVNNVAFINSIIRYLDEISFLQ